MDTIKREKREQSLWWQEAMLQ